MDLGGGPMNPLHQTLPSSPYPTPPGGRPPSCQAALVAGPRTTQPGLRAAPVAGLRPSRARVASLHPDAQRAPVSNVVDAAHFRTLQDRVAAAASMPPPPPRAPLKTASRTPKAKRASVPRAKAVTVTTARTKSSAGPKPKTPRRQGLSKPPHSGVAHTELEAQVPAAHFEFQAMLETDVPAESEDGLNLFDEMTESAAGFGYMMADAIGIEDFTTPADAYEEYTEEEEYTEQDTMEVPTPTSKKWARGVNYSTAEDEALVLAWENVSTDPVIGKDQPSSAYWQRITDYYHENVKVASNRSSCSLNHRWSTIAECCTRWSGCVVNVERQQPSGLTMQDRLNYTQELYKQRDPHHRSFVMLHCWTLLQHNEKWINRDKDPHPLKKRASDMESGDYEDDESERSTTPCSERPPGRKKEKERRKNGGGDAAVFESAVQEMVTTKKEIEASRKVDKQARWNQLTSLQERLVEIEEEKLRVQREEVSARKMKEENNIMFKDLHGLDANQLAYIQAMRAQIVASKIGAGQSGSGHESV